MSLLPFYVISQVPYASTPVSKEHNVDDNLDESQSTDVHFEVLFLQTEEIVDLKIKCDINGRF